VLVSRAQVDAKALGLKDYHEVITQPMDLGTITSKLQANKYEKEEELFNDVILTFNNAMKYNPEDNHIHLLAVQLKKKFRDNWTKARPDSGVNEVLDSRELNGDACNYAYCLWFCSCHPRCCSVGFISMPASIHF